MRINQELTREFLQSHGIQFDGAYWVNPNLPFRLQASNVEGTWMVTIPELPVGAHQPAPIKNYSELLKLMLGTLQYFINKKKQLSQPTNPQEEIQLTVNCIGEVFGFDKNLVFGMNITPMGAQIFPGNEYTHTAITGNEEEFVVLYTDRGKGEKFECSYSPECISKSFLTELISKHIGKKVEDINVTSVHKMNGNALEAFFGAGLNIPKNK